MAYDTFKYNITKSVGIISERTDHNGIKWTKEVNMVSWNDREPKVDIREWNEDHSRMGRGLTLTTEEVEMLCMILHEHMRERSK
jgi:hypothetical protein